MELARQDDQVAKKITNSAHTGLGDKPLTIKTIDQLKALAHPLRLQLFDQFAVKPRTTKQIALELGLQPTPLYHHVAKLEAAGLIRLVKTRPVRGTIEKYYSAASESLKIDRRAFKSQSAKILGDILGARVIENLLGMVQEEVSDYLSQLDALDEDKSSTNEIHNEVMFANTEFEIDESKVPLFRDKVTQLIDELGELAKPVADNAGHHRRYRLIVGWYPRTSDQDR